MMDRLAEYAAGGLASGAILLSDNHTMSLVSTSRFLTQSAFGIADHVGSFIAGQCSPTSR